MSRTMITRALVAAVALLCLTGCGNDDKDDDGAADQGKRPAGAAASRDDEQGRQDEPKAELAVVRKPFCEGIPMDVVIPTLGIKGAPTREARKPGDTFEVLDLEQKESGFYCQVTEALEPFRTLTYRISGGPATPAVLDGRIKGLKQLNQDARCAETSDEVFGPTTWGRTCARKEIDKTGTYRSGYADVAHLGLIGDVLTECYVGSSDSSAAATLEAAAEKLCPLLLQAAAPGK